MKNFEVANSGDDEGLIKASQKALISAMREVIGGLRGDTKAPGLTWEQIDFILDGFEKKEPTIIRQDEAF